ncbi:MAG: substrate-binding domain-containing protein [Candidatus Aminicenantes bacterium]
MKKTYIILMVSILIFSACRRDSAQKPEEAVLTLGAYTVPREVYEKEIIPAFQKTWRNQTGQQVKFQQSYIASGAQSRAIEQGFEADIAALSLEGDVERLRKSGLITHDWKNKTGGGFVTRSVAAVAFREGNPKNLNDWKDLARDNVDVLYPSPKTSGGAMWDIIAVYGAGLKISEARTGTADPAFARNLLKSIQKNVRAMAKSPEV